MEDRIRELAYLKWEAAGYPSGDGVNFWVEAETELNSNVCEEDHKHTAACKTKTKKVAASTKKTEPTKVAAKKSSAKSLKSKGKR